MFMIATRPGRSTKRAKNRVQKYAQVQPNGKFKWVTNPNEATVFKTASDLLFAYGIRVGELNNDPTKDVTWAEVEQAGVSVKRIYNGH